MFRKGDVLCFLKTRHIFGQAISVFTGSDVVHVGICLGPRYFLESSVRGVRISLISKALKRKQKIIHCQLKNEDYNKIVHNQKLFDDCVEEELHKPYDFRQIGQFVLNIFSFGAYKPAEDNKLNVCSELVAYLFEKVGILKDVNTSLYTPKDIFNLDYKRRRNLK